MKIGIIGAGNIGHTTARLLVQAGHEVALSNSRGPESLRDAIAKLGERAHAATVDEAAAFGDVVLLAVPWSNPDALPKPETVAGKIVVDAMNHYKPDYSLYDLGDSTSSEETTKRLPGARLVKAFNTIWYKHLAEQGDVSKPEDQRRAIFVAADDAEAKAIVSDLIRDLGFAPVDTGSLHEGGRKQQPDAELYNNPMTAEKARQVLAALA